MRVKILKAGQVQIIEEPDLVLIETNDGNPVSVASRYGPAGAFVVSCIDDEERFNRTLRGLGIDRTVIKVPLDKQLKRPSDLQRVL